MRDVIPRPNASRPRPPEPAVVAEIAALWRALRSNSGQVRIGRAHRRGQAAGGHTRLLKIAEPQRAPEGGGG